MDDATLRVLEECTRASDEERITFPAVVGMLMAAGIERYHADLVRGERTYYEPSGNSATLRCHALQEAPAAPFLSEGVASAVRAVQAGELGYGAFCARIAAAGCVGYLVSLAGRRVVYFGRTAELHVEHFPQAG